MIKIPESEYDVKQLFEEAGRDHYSLDAYSYIWEMYRECRLECFTCLGELDFDAFAWSLDYDEQSAEKFMEMYDIEAPDDWSEMSDDELTEYVLNELNEHTDAIATNGGILCKVF